MKLFSIFNCLFNKKKQDPLPLNIKKLPFDLRCVILAHYFENKIKNAPAFYISYTFRKCIPLPYDFFLEIHVNLDNDFDFESPRLTRDFYSTFDIKENDNDAKSALILIRKLLRSKIIRNHIETYIMCQFHKQGPHEMLTSYGQIKFYSILFQLLSDMVVQSRDCLLHYLTIEYILTSQEKKKKTFICQLYANITNNCFQLHVDGQIIQFELKDRNIASSLSNIVLFLQYFHGVNVQNCTFEFLDEGLLSDYNLKIV